VQKSKLTEVLPVPTRCGDCPIRRQALFQVVSDEYLNEAEARRNGQYRLAARHQVYQQGAPATMAYTVFNGWLLLYRTHSDGSRQGLRIALPGDFVGYVPLDDSHYSHSAMAVTDAVLCGFRQPDMQAIINKDANIARQITTIQAGYLATCEENVLGLGRKSAEQRIAFAIAELRQRLERLGMVEPSAAAIPFPLTQEMLGELTGLTPVHTNRVLRRLREDGVMACERQRVEILDPQRLVTIGEFQDDHGH
jgi:CRP-like cAMP-binding protein